MNKSILVCCSILLFGLVGLTGCSSVNRNLENNVQEVFPEIEGSNLHEYVETYSIPANSENYLKAEKISLEAVKEALAVEDELIPFEGELGGSPYIVLESVKLVGDQWVYCYAEDGHVSADMLVKFIVTDGEQVDFRVCATDFNGEGTIIAATLIEAETTIE